MSGIIEVMTFAALIVGTFEYALLLRRRVVQRWDEEAAASGLRGLVRTTFRQHPAPPTPHGAYLPE